MILIFTPLRTKFKEGCDLRLDVDGAEVATKEGEDKRTL
jgi:hypothetical protein